MFAIGFRDGAWEELAQLRKFDQVVVQEAINAQLLHQPAQETRQRKRLRPNPLADWELRIGKFRVFYDVDEAGEQVTIGAIGYKQGSRLFIRDQEYQL